MRIVQAENVRDAEAVPARPGGREPGARQGGDRPPVPRPAPRERGIAPGGRRRPGPLRLMLLLLGHLMALGLLLLAYGYSWTLLD